MEQEGGWISQEAWKRSCPAPRVRMQGRGTSTGQPVRGCMQAPGACSHILNPLLAVINAMASRAGQGVLGWSAHEVAAAVVLGVAPKPVVGDALHRKQAGTCKYWNPTVSKCQVSAHLQDSTARQGWSRTSRTAQPPLTGWQKPSTSVARVFWHLLVPQQSSEVSQPHRVSSMHWCMDGREGDSAREPVLVSWKEQQRSLPSHPSWHPTLELGAHLLALATGRSAGLELALAAIAALNRPLAPKQVCPYALQR